MTNALADLMPEAAIDPEAETNADATRSEYIGSWVRWPCVAAAAAIAAAHLAVGDLPWLALLVPIVAVNAWTDLRTRETVDGWAAAGILLLLPVALITGGWHQAVLSCGACAAGILLAWIMYRVGGWGDGDIAHFGFCFGTVALVASSAKFTAAYGNGLGLKAIAAVSVFGLIVLALVAVTVVTMVACRVAGKPFSDMPLAAMLGPLCLIALLVPADWLVSAATLA